MPIKILLYILAFTLLFSCTSEKPFYEGEWLNVDKYGTEYIVSVDDQAVKLGNIDYQECDTIYTVHSIENQVRALNGTYSFRINQGGRNGASMIFEPDSIDVAYMVFDDGKRKPQKFMRSKGLLAKIERPKREQNLVLNELAWEINRQNQYFQENWKQNESSLTAITLINYIDSLRDQILLQELELKFDDVNCWHRQDSLLSYKSVSKLVYGIDPKSPKEDHFSASKLKMYYGGYLKKTKNQVHAELAEPSYKDLSLQNWRDSETREELSWVYMNFCYVGLGQTILRLNEIKSTVARLENYSDEKMD